MRRVFSLLVLFTFFAPSLQAAETDWQYHEAMLKTRLVSASSALNKGGAALLAWEADLKPGWKAYWRSPGEAGLPVRIQANNEPVEALFPLPERFELFGMHTYGYGGRVLLPFYVKNGEAATVQADFMVCKDICVPFSASYQMSAEQIAPENSDHDTRLSAWLTRVPTREGDGGAGLSIEEIRLTGREGHQRLVIDVSADVNLSDADIMAEVNDMVHFGVPERRLLADGTSARFVLVAMMGNMPFDLAGHKVRLTFTDGKGHAIDRDMLID